MTSLILASSSPFRRKLLENAGLSFEVHPAELDERAIEASLDEEQSSPQQISLMLARAKALDVSRHFSATLVLGSDQTMSLGSRVFHKPKNLNDAKQHIKSLSGRTHRLNSGIALARDGAIIWDHVDHAELTVRSLNEEFIDRYIDQCGDKLLGSVGAYQLEAEGIQLFSKIVGDYFTILGLPMLPLLKKLREVGAIDG